MSYTPPLPMDPNELKRAIAWIRSFNPAIPEPKRVQFIGQYADRAIPVDRLIFDGVDTTFDTLGTYLNPAITLIILMVELKFGNPYVTHEFPPPAIAPPSPVEKPVQKVGALMSETPLRYWGTNSYPAKSGEMTTGPKGERLIYVLSPNPFGGGNYGFWQAV